MSRKRNEVCVAIRGLMPFRFLIGTGTVCFTVEGYIHWRKDDEYLCYSNV